MGSIVRSTIVLAVSAGLVAAAACSSEQTTSPVEPAALAGAVGLDALVGHLDALQRIADQHNGNRAAATPGYDASVDYVAGKLRDRGFDVQTPEFSIDNFEVNAENLQLDGREIPVKALGYSPATPSGGLSARVVVVPPTEKPGCAATDYDTVDVKGSIALVQRGVCPFADKARIAADRGAVAMVVVDPTADGAPNGATLGADAKAKIPAAIVGKADRDALAGGGTVRLTLDTKTTSQRSRNVIAQTRTGSTENVVMAGSHLDSVPEGPGINDNGTGTSAVLETALQLGPEPKVNNAVRFAWWGGEELGLIGSTAYVDGLTPEQRADIALYLNFDMLGSPNPGYLVYDGDNSDNTGEPAGPEGSAGIERTVSVSLLDSGVTPEGTDFDGRSDYGPFIEHKIPAGGTFSGAEEKKTAEQAARWGGTADQPFDPNYHSAKDTVANVDKASFDRNADSVAYAVATYAQSIDGPNGVPVKPDRAKVRGSDE